MRIVSVWLPRWPIQRFLIAEGREPPPTPVDPQRPFVCAVDASGGPCITAANAAAERLGLAAGDRLADARAKAGMLQVRPADPAADDAALLRLALWATRYTPAVARFGEADGADGFFLDITGASHLFGGEEELLTDLAWRLDRFGLSARLAVADTAGAAWALSRFHPAPPVALNSGREAEALAPLPIEALRLSADTRTTLRRLGFKRVGALIDKPRAPFSARFERELLRRLDQALGRAAEPLQLVVPPPVYHSIRYLLEPVFTQAAVVRLSERLMHTIGHALARDGVGARALRLTLYRVDGETLVIDLGLARPTRNAEHVARLIDLKLERMGPDVDAGFGFETIGLAITTAERMDDRQVDLACTTEHASAERCAALIDSLQQRLGPGRVRRLAPVASHLPEQAETSYAAAEAPAAWPAPDDRPRPLLMLAQAEVAADVLALVPEGPPRRISFCSALITSSAGKSCSVRTRVHGSWV